MQGTVDERFWAKVDKDGAVVRAELGPCWTWTARRNAGGYGTIAVGRRQSLANRVSWALHFGEIPDGLFVLHRCDNPPCVNPAHLFLGTHRDNARDKAEKGRAVGMPGTRNGRARLTEMQVSEIRAAAAGGESHYAIARRYGVSHTQVWSIHRGKAWKTQRAAGQAPA